jgi:Heterokaryon incompatibility protein (HET)
MNDSTRKLGRSEIRLLRLKPRRYQHLQLSLEQFHNVTVFCELEVASRQLCAPYIALSYAWGNGNGNLPICVGDTIVRISINLEAALQELRDEQDDLMLWVDQLCINQEDEEEKGQQVKEMKNIYAQATHVITWIGVAADNSDLILAHLNSIGERAPESTETLDKSSFQYMINSTFASILPALADLQNLEAVSIGFRQFCQQPY